LGRNFALTRAAPIQLALNIRLGDVDLRRTTIDHDTDAAAVRLAECRNAKKLAEGIPH
jgi:hypothetical protein